MFTNVKEICNKYYINQSQCDVDDYIIDIFNGNLEKCIDNPKYYRIIGLYYSDIENNYDEALKYYLLAIEMGNNDALCTLGYYYQTVEKNYDLMMKYYLPAIENGDSDAMCNLGDYYVDIEKNYDEAIKYYLMAIENGNSDAMNNLGYYYLNNEINYDEAVKYYLMAIENGNCTAMCNLGCYYGNIEKKYDEAIKYYLMSIKNYNNNALKLYIKIATNKLEQYIKLRNIDYDTVRNYIKSNLSAEKQIIDGKIKNCSKIDECSVCIESKLLIVLNCFNHYVCLDCYSKVIASGKCPECRFEF
jgi:TPR repeat protein